MKYLKWGLTMIASTLVPGSGYVFVGAPQRGLIMLLWMVSFSYITWQLTPSDAPFFLRIFGGLMVWLISMVDIGKRAGKLWWNHN